MVPAIHQGNFPLHVEALSSVQLVFRAPECNIWCYNGDHNNVNLTGSRAQTGVPGWGLTGEARLIKVTHRTVFVHSFAHSSTYITIGDE